MSDQQGTAQAARVTINHIAGRDDTRERMEELFQTRPTVLRYPVFGH
jgi:hypothetical protein